MVLIDKTKPAGVDGPAIVDGPNAATESTSVTPESAITETSSSSETNPALLRGASIAKALAACAIKEGRPLEDHEIITAITHLKNENISTPMPKKQGFIFRWLNKVDTFLALFDKEPKVNVEKLVKAAQEHLGIKDEDIPKVHDNFEGLPIYFRVNAALYNDPTSSIHILPSGFDTFKSYLSIAGIRESLLDRLPQSVKNFLGNINRIGNDPINSACHELTHHRQVLPVLKLTRSEAIDAIKDYIKKHNIQVKEGDSDYDFIIEINLNRFPPFLEERITNIQEDEIENGKKALISNLEHLFANDPAHHLHSKSMRQYTTNPNEVEARCEAAAFCVKDAIELVKKAGQGIPVRGEKLEDAYKKIRSFQMEELMNDTLVKIEELKTKQSPPEEIELLEQKLRQIVAKSPRNTTRDFLKKEYKLAKQESKKPGLITRLK